MDSPGIPEALELERLLAVAAEVARACGRLIVDERPRDVGVAATKSSVTDVVTVMDQRSEELARALLTARRPGDAILGEEGAAVEGTTGITWLVDPIDGTVNYLYGIEAYAVSVAAVVGDPSVEGGWAPVAGAVYQPATNELYLARSGGGARLVAGDGDVAELRALLPDDLAACLVGTGFGYRIDERVRQGAEVARVLPRVRDIRRHGSAALDLCSVARGRLDAYYERCLNPWDLAAGWLVAQEAGAVVRGADGGRPDRNLTLAGSAAAVAALSAILAG